MIENEESMTCPACGADFIPVIYGMPGPDLVEAEERGEVILGGCVPMLELPAIWHCKGNPQHLVEEDERGRLTVVEPQADDDLDVD